jgi:hypothetical protein
VFPLDRQTDEKEANVDIVLRAIRDLVAQIKLTVAQSTNISLAEVERRLDTDRLVIAPAARKYTDQLRVLWAWMTEQDSDLREYWMARNWIHRFALTSVYADDPITEDDEEYRLRPGEVIAFLLAHDCEFIEGPSPTQEGNEIFFEAQRGGYSQDGDDPFHYDTTDTRIPDGWAEYLEPLGAGQFYANPVWKWLREAMQEAIDEADGPQKWDYVRDVIREDVERVWDTAVAEYLGGEMNVVALAMVAHRLTSATRFTPEEVLVRARKVPWFSHVDGAQLGTFDQFLTEYRDELDDIVEEGVSQDWSPMWQEQKVANEWADHFERELEAHWTAQAQARKPVLIENGVKVWASAWISKADVAYNLAYLRSVAMGFTKAEVVAAADKAREEARKWVPNQRGSESQYLVIDANQKGVVLADQTMLPWVQAAKVTGKLMVKSGEKDGLLDRMRGIYGQTNGARPHLAKVGKAIAAL